MSPIKSISTCFSKFAIFEGRATRSEFWWFTLFVIIINLLSAIFSPALNFVVSVLLLIPALAVGCRRLHDTNRSGWWLLIGIIPIIGLILIFFYAQNSVEPNQYGSNDANTAHDEKKSLDYGDTQRVPGSNEKPGLVTQIPTKPDSGKIVSTTNSIESDFKKAAEFFPRLIELRAAVATYGEETQIKFVQTIIQEKAFSNPDVTFEKVRQGYLASQFGDNIEIQRYGDKLIQNKQIHAINILKDYVRILGENVDASMIIDRVEAQLNTTNYTKKIERLYEVSKQGHIYYVAILRDGSCIGSISGSFKKESDIVNFRRKAKDYDAIYDEILKKDEFQRIASHIPSELL